MNDIFEQDIKEINQELADLLLRHIILPVLVGSLGSERHMQHHLGIPLAAYLIIQILKTIRHPPLINTLVACLFLKEVREELLTLTMNSPPLQALAGASRDLSPSSDAIRLGSQMLDYLDYLEEPENLRHNTIRDVIFSFLRSRDDNLVTLTVLIIQGVILNGSVSPTILWGAGLMPVEIKKMDQSSALEENKGSGDEIKDPQKNQYDSGVISMLLRLINLEPSFRIFTCHAICKLMLSLVYKTNSISCLLPEHELSLKKALKRTNDALKKLVKANFHDSLLLELFEEEWNRVANLKFNEKIICPSHLLLPLLNELESNISLEHRRPSGDVEEARCNVSLFFLYRKMHHLLCAKDVNADFDIETYPLNYMKTPCLWKEGEVHSMGKNYLDGRTCFRCYVKDGKKEKTLYFTEDDDKFVLVEPDIELMGYAKIVIITNLRDVEAMTDRSDPRSLVLLVKQKTDNTQLILTFEDAQRCLWIKRQIEDHRKSSKSEDMGLIEVLLNTIDECLVK